MTLDMAFQCVAQHIRKMEKKRWNETVKRTVETQQNESRFNYHLFTESLRPRETVCFVDPRPSMFPEAKPRETSTVHKTHCFPEVSVNKCFIIY